VRILLAQRGEHEIEHELVFSSHDGYVFHDSRGFEGGDKRELKIVQDFVFRRSREVRLKDRLHAIWSDSFEYLPLQNYKICFSGTAFRWTMTGHP
jgi:hypothetical protein